MRKNQIETDFIPLKKRKPLSAAQLARNSAAGKKGIVAAMVVIREKKLKRLQIEKLSEQKLLRGVDAALQSMMVAMKGTHHVYIAETDSEGKRKLTRVRDIDQIDKLIETGIYGTDYLITAGAEPDWRAADAFLSRALGKPSETLKIKGKIEHEFSLKSLNRGSRKIPAHVAQNLFQPLPPKHIEAKIVEQPTEKP